MDEFKFKPQVPELKEVVEGRKRLLPKYAKKLAFDVMTGFNADINRAVSKYGFAHTFDGIEDILSIPNYKDYKKEGFFTRYIAHNPLYDLKLVGLTYSRDEQRKIVEITDKMDLPDDTRVKIRLFIDFKFIGAIFGNYENYDSDLDDDFPHKFSEYISGNLKELFPIQYDFYEDFYELIKAYKEKGYRILEVNKEGSMYNDCNFINSLHIYAK